MAAPRFIKDIARALVDVSIAEDAVARVIADLREVEAAFRKDSHLAVDLEESCVPLEDRQAALTKSLTGSTHPLVLNTLLVLQKRQLLSHLSPFFTTVLKLSQERASHFVATVRTATVLTPKELTSIKETLANRFKGTIELHEILDSTLIGGFQVSVGGWNFDSSVKGKLERLSLALAA